MGLQRVGVGAGGGGEGVAVGLEGRVVPLGGEDGGEGAEGVGELLGGFSFESFSILVFFFHFERKLWCSYVLIEGSKGRMDEFDHLPAFLLRRRRGKWYLLRQTVSMMEVGYLPLPLTGFG